MCDLEAMGNQSALSEMYGSDVAGRDVSVRAGVGVIVRDAEGRILLEQRRDCGLWGLPGGRIEPGESIIDAATREVHEETGLTIRVTHLIGVYSEPDGRIVTYPDNGDVVQLVDVVLHAVATAGSLRPSHESFAVRFFHAEELPSEIVPPARAPIHDALNRLAGILR